MNEHLWALLALALYRAGRQVDSLNAYHRARAALLDVGVESGRELDELHQRVLRHDASLAGPVPPALRSEEHTSELQSLMRISYAVFCLTKKTTEVRLKKI